MVVQIYSLAEWNVQLSQELQSHWLSLFPSHTWISSTSAPPLSQSPITYLQRWLTSSIKVSPSVTICRFNHCYNNHNAATTPTVVNDVIIRQQSVTQTLPQVMDALKVAMEDWLLQRGHNHHPSGMDDWRSPHNCGTNHHRNRYEVLVTQSHTMLEDAICIEIVHCQPQQLHAPTVTTTTTTTLARTEPNMFPSLYTSKTPPPLDTWYDAYSKPSELMTEQLLTPLSLSSTEIPHNNHPPHHPGVEHDPTSRRATTQSPQQQQQQHMWRRNLGHWPPYPYGVVIVDRLCGEAILRGADVYPTTGIVSTDSYIVQHTPVAIYVEMTTTNDPYHDTTHATNDPNRKTNSRRRNKNLRPKSNISRGISLQEYSTSDNHKTVVFIGIGMATCSRSAMFSSTTSRNRQNTVSTAAIHMIQIAIPTTTPSTQSYILPPMHEILPRDHHYLVVQNLPSIVVAHALLDDSFAIRIPAATQSLQESMLQHKDSSNESTTSDMCRDDDGEWMLDMCCAPGGKTSHLASLLLLRQQNVSLPYRKKSTIVACDKSRTKVLHVRDALQKLGCLTNNFVIPLVLDTTKCILPTDTEDATPIGTNEFSVRKFPTLSEVRIPCFLIELCTYSL
jgi:hypothetical protein